MFLQFNKITTKSMLALIFYVYFHPFLATIVC